MKTILCLCLTLLTSVALATEVQWTRFKGTVKSLNYKTSSITIQNADGDLFSLKLDKDVKIKKDKGEVSLDSVELDDKITLLYLPSNPKNEAALEGEEKLDEGQPWKKR